MQQKPISSLLQTILQNRNPAMRILIIFCIAMNFFSFNLPIVHAEKGESPTQLVQKGPLVGAAAVEYLKQSGEYTALQSAFSEAQSASRAARSQAPTTPFNLDAYVKASNTESGDNFGWSVAISGNTAVVGAYHEGTIDANNFLTWEGAAYVFVNDGTKWSQQAFLKASNPGVGDQFGYSIAISGDTIVIGAKNEASNADSINGDQNDNSAPYAGAAYVFVRNGTAWSQQAYLKASNSDGGIYYTGDQFGTSVAIDGDTIIVGAPGEDSNATGINGNQNDNSAPESGAAYIFERTGTVWSQQDYIKASGATVGYFGNAVAMEGNRVVVGGGSSAFVFERSNVIWSQQARIPIGTNTQSVALSGDTIVVSGQVNDVNANYTNSVSVFVNDGTNWVQQAFLSPGVTYSTRSYAVAIEGDKLVVGSTGAAGFILGAVYVYNRNGGVWTLESTLQSPLANYYNAYGWPVAISPNYLIVGSTSDSSSATGINGNQSDMSANASGAAYFYSTTPPAVPTCAGLTQEAETSNAILSGFSVANDPAASGGAYIGAPSGGFYYNGPNPSFKAEYCFNVPTAGTYRIKAKTYAADNLSDSFYVTVDGAPAAGYLWDVAQNTNYATDYVNDRNNADPVEVQLSAGQHVVTVYLREQGTRLDTIALEQVVTPPEPTCAGLVQEAESGVITGNWGIGNDGAASGGSYIDAPEGSGNFWNGANATQKASYCFNVATAGTYRIKGKVYGADTLSDSFYVQVDGAPTSGYLWDILPNTTYASDFVNDRGVVDPVEVQLTAGQHTVNLFVREDGTRLDTIELQLVDSGPPPTPVCAGLTQEAESGALRGNFTIGNDTAASGGQYVGTPVGSGDFWNGANANHSVSYCFNVPTAGTYRIDGKVYGADTLSDSFYVQVDGAPSSGYLWDVLRNTSYEIDSVNNRNVANPVLVTLSSGQHTVTVFARESGTRLDTIQLNSVVPTAQGRAIPILAQGVHGTIHLNASNLSAEVDFSTIQLTLSDAETNGQTFRQTVTADRFGSYHFDGMMPGKYVVQMELPSGLLAGTSEVTVTATADEPVNVDFAVSTGNKTYLPLIGR